MTTPANVNEHGVFVPTEIIEHATPSGARLRVELAQCPDGWREGIGYSGQWCGGDGKTTLSKLLKSNA